MTGPAYDGGDAAGDECIKDGGSGNCHGHIFGLLPAPIVRYNRVQDKDRSMILRTLTQVLASLALLGLLLVAACEEDTTQPVADPSYRSLTNKDDTLKNLELAYDERNLAEIKRMLDPDFTFCYQPAQSVKCWSRSEDLAITESMFQPGGAASRVAAAEPLRIRFASSYGPWIPATPTDGRYAGVILFEKLVDYQVTAGSSSSTGRATFIVRALDTLAGERWYIFGIFDHSGHWGDTKSDHEAPPSN